MAIKSVSISPEFLEGEDGSALTFEEADFVDGVWARKVQAKTDSDGDSCDVIVVTDSKNDDGSDMTAKETIEIERTVIALFDKVKSACKVGISYQVGYTITGEKEKDDLVRFPSGVTRVDYVFDSDDGTDANVSVGEWTGDSELRKTSSVSADRPGTLTLYLYINDALFDKLSIVFVDIVLADLIEALQERGMAISDDADLETAISVSRNAIDIFGYEYKWNDYEIDSNGVLHGGGAELTKYAKSLIDDSILSKLDDKGKICLVYGYIVNLKYNVIPGLYFKKIFYVNVKNSASTTGTIGSEKNVSVYYNAAEKFNTANAVEDLRIIETEGSRYSVGRGDITNSNTLKNINEDIFSVIVKGSCSLWYSDPFSFDSGIVEDYNRANITSSKNGTITIRAFKKYGHEYSGFNYKVLSFFKKYNFKNRFINDIFDCIDIGVEELKEKVRDGSYLRKIGQEAGDEYVYFKYSSASFGHFKEILLEMSDLKHVA